MNFFCSSSEGDDHAASKNKVLALERDMGVARNDEEDDVDPLDAYMTEVKKDQEAEEAK